MASFINKAGTRFLSKLIDQILVYRLRWKRRRLIARSFRKARDLTCKKPPQNELKSTTIMCFCVVRNEIERLPDFLNHYRTLGVTLFFIVDNDSNDGTLEYLISQNDVALWHTAASYKKSRFGMDWLNYLLRKYGHGHWCVTVDADELLIYPNHTTRPLHALTQWLDKEGKKSFGTLMLDLYPNDTIDDTHCSCAQPPLRYLEWFDAGNYIIELQPKLRNLWVQGGPRARVFFGAQPERAPTLNKIPLVRWHRTYVYNSSTHNMLPRCLNQFYATDMGEATTGVLLHTKFFSTIVAKSREEKKRKEHFENSDLYNTYYDRIVQGINLKCEYSTKFTGWRQLERLGLMSRGGWL